MLEIRNLKAASFDLGYMDLSWEVSPTQEDIWEYRFVVERSESSMGPWEQVSLEFTDRYFFRDITAIKNNRYTFFYYRIKIKHQPTSVEKFSDVISQQAKPDLIACEVRRLEHLLFREYIGRRCFLFPRRTFGQRCPSCYDPISKQQLHDRCPTCFDTTFVRGFLDPIQIWMQFDPSPRSTELAEIMETQQENTSGRALAYPQLKPRDIIVEAENRRWRVVRVSLTERLRAPLHQELVLHALPLGDIEWELPVRLDNLLLFEPSPERNFENAHSLEADKEGEFLDAAQAVYGFRGQTS